MKSTLLEKVLEEMTEEEVSELFEFSLQSLDEEELENLSEEDLVDITRELVEKSIKDDEHHKMPEGLHKHLSTIKKMQKKEKAQDSEHHKTMADLINGLLESVSEGSAIEASNQFQEIMRQKNLEAVSRLTKEFYAESVEEELSQEEIEESLSEMSEEEFSEILSELSEEEVKELTEMLSEEIEKLALNEEVELSEEDLFELSKKTLSNYLHKSGKDIGKREASNDSLRSKVFNNSPRSHPGIPRKDAQSIVDRQDKVYRKAVSRNDKKIWNREKGAYSAKKRLQSTSEEVENLDELSNNTLQSYAQKALRRANSDSTRSSNYKKKANDTKAEMKNWKPGGIDWSKRKKSSENSEKLSTQAQDRANKRFSGVELARKKMGNNQ